MELYESNEECVRDLMSLLSMNENQDTWPPFLKRTVYLHSVKKISSRFFCD